MQKKNFNLSVLLIMCVLSIPLGAQETTTIKGKITESKTGEGISGVNVLIKNSQTGTMTDIDGYYKIPNVIEGTHTLVISYVGYQRVEKKVNAKRGLSDVNFKIHRKATELKDVEVHGNQRRKTEDVLKLAVPLKDIPITTSTVSNELIEQKQLTSINDALQYTTGVNPTVNYGGFQTFNMRGFGGAVIMVDGARDERMNFSNSAPVTSLAATERIEYLKGPASVLYGHSAVGGIINIVRKQPTSEFTANMSATVGSWDTKDIILGSGGKLNDKLNYRFDMGVSDNTGWRENSTNYLNAYVAFDYQVNENNSFEIRVGGNDDRYGTEAGLPALRNTVYNSDGSLAYNQGELPVGFKRNVRYNDPFDYLIHENWNASVKYKHEFSEKSRIQFHASYAHDIIDYFSTEALRYLTNKSAIYDYYYLDSDNNKMYICLDTLQRPFPFRFSHHTNTYQNYVDFTTSIYSGNVKHNLLIGYYLMHVDRTTYTGYKLGEDVTGDGLGAKVSVVEPIVNQGDLQTKFSGARNYTEVINSIYMQDLLDITDRFKALIAARFDYYQMAYQTGVVESGFRQINLSDKSNLNASAVTYRAGLVYKPISNLSLYASYSNFFQPNRRVYIGDYVYVDKDGKEFFPEEGKQFFKPKKGYQLEGGFKYLLNHVLQINASTFYIEKNNIIEYLGRTSDDKKIYGQVGLVGSKGVEIEAAVTPFQGFRAILGYGFTNATYLKFATNEYIQNSKEGNSVSQCPKNKIYSWAYYKVPKGKLKNIGVGAGIKYTGTTYTGSSNTYTLPEYCLVDANIGYNIENIYLKFGIYNILDKKYYSNYIMSTQYIPGAERNYKFTIGFKL